MVINYLHCRQNHHWKVLAMLRKKIAHISHSNLRRYLIFTSTSYKREFLVWNIFFPSLNRKSSPDCMSLLNFLLVAIMQYYSRSHHKSYFLRACMHIVIDTANISHSKNVCVKLNFKRVQDLSIRFTSTSTIIKKDKRSSLILYSFNASFVVFCFVFVFGLRFISIFLGYFFFSFGSPSLDC